MYGQGVSGANPEENSALMQPLDDRQLLQVGGTSNIIPFRRPFFFLIQLVVVLI
jgi:hypothetical protein